MSVPPARMGQLWGLLQPVLIPRFLFFVLLADTTVYKTKHKYNCCNWNINVFCKEAEECRKRFFSAKCKLVFNFVPAKYVVN